MPFLETFLSLSLTHLFSTELLPRYTGGMTSIAKYQIIKI